jgi:hypothetical protein
LGFAKVGMANAKMRRTAKKRFIGILLGTLLSWSGEPGSPAMFPLFWLLLCLVPDSFPYRNRNAMGRFGNVPERAGSRARPRGRLLTGEAGDV